MKNQTYSERQEKGKEAMITNYQTAKAIVKGMSHESKYFWLQAMLKDGYINKREYMDLIYPTN